MGFCIALAGHIIDVTNAHVDYLSCRSCQSFMSDEGSFAFMSEVRVIGHQNCLRRSILTAMLVFTAIKLSMRGCFFYRGRSV